MNLKWILSSLILVGLGFATLTIPPDQPICNLYGMIQLFGTIIGILVAAYAGLILASTHDTTERNRAKMLIEGVVLGLAIIWLAPLVVTNLVGGASVCGWS